jgi:hypothetical protein
MTADMRSPDDFPSLQHLRAASGKATARRDDGPSILLQALRREFLQEKPGAWTTLYEQVENGPLRVGRYCAMAPKRLREQVVKKPSWDLMIGHGIPGFTQSFSGGRKRTSYSRLSNEGGIEPMVHVRHFYSVKPTQVEISEEFRLFHNLYTAEAGTLIRIDDDGYEYTAATVARDFVRVDTGLLRQYQAARQLDLLLFIDATYRDKTTTNADEKVNQPSSTPLTCTLFHIGDLDGEAFSRFLGKRIIPAPSKREAGVWPYERPERYPSYVIDVDEQGRNVAHTCDPTVLADYFGGNAEAPHYLTPVYFSRDVLQKYYEQPEKYVVDDGYLRCCGLWGLRLDNNHPEYIVVHLGDLGRDLPERERDYWKSFNIRPSGGMSETAFRRAFLGQFASAEAPDLVFRSQYERTAKRWAEVHGWELWRSPNPGDEHLLQGVRVPDTQPEFDRQLVNLARLMVDALNDEELAQRTTGLAGGERSIGKLEMWLRQEGYAHAGRDVKFLRDLQQLRSTGGAHRKGSQFTALLVKLTGSTTPRAVMVHLLNGATTLLGDMAAHFGLRE